MVSGLLQSRVSTVLDAMGQASALAQDLRAPITSGKIVKSLPCFFYQPRNGQVLGYCRSLRRHVLLFAHFLTAMLRLGMIFLVYFVSLVTRKLSHQYFPLIAINFHYQFLLIPKFSGDVLLLGRCNLIVGSKSYLWIFGQCSSCVWSLFSV